MRGDNSPSYREEGSRGLPGKKFENKMKINKTALKKVWSDCKVSFVSKMLLYAHMFGSLLLNSITEEVQCALHILCLELY